MPMGSAMRRARWLLPTDYRSKLSCVVLIIRAVECTSGLSVILRIESWTKDLDYT